MDFQTELNQLEEADLYRRLRALPQAGGRVVFNARGYLNFSCNDYLNLANDARVKAAAMCAVEAYGCGATASRLMSGHLDLHEELEGALAAMTGHESALVFPSGFQCNVAVLSTLARRGDLVLSDALNHASLIDGMRLSRAEVQVYRHGDVAHVEALLRASLHRKKFVVTDSVFSMDGDAAPLAELAELAQAHGAMLVVDEAHAIGVRGGGVGREVVENKNRGSVDATPLSRSAASSGLPLETGTRGALGNVADVTLGTLSKSLGSAGGFVACSLVVREFLINKARPFIYSTGLAPACAAAALEAIRIVREEHDLGARLLERTRVFVEALQARDVPAAYTESPIIPIVLGANRAALDAASALFAEGIIATAVRPPTVPEGTARLRLSVTLAHGEKDLVKAADTIAAVLQRQAVTS